MNNLLYVIFISISIYIITREKQDTKVTQLNCPMQRPCVSCVTEMGNKFNAGHKRKEVVGKNANLALFVIQEKLDCSSHFGQDDLFFIILYNLLTISQPITGHYQDNELFTMVKSNFMLSFMSCDDFNQSIKTS